MNRLNYSKPSRVSRVDLICLGGSTPLQWPLGEVLLVEPTPPAVHALVSKYLPDNNAHAWLFWETKQGNPDPQRILTALSRPGDVWHWGLRLGLSGLPGAIDFIAPTWPLNRDPDPEIEATSWRLSLRACLVRVEVLRQMGCVWPDFRSLDGASLEMGHRYITYGVITRHLPLLLPDKASASGSRSLSFEDELRFIYYRYNRSWSFWTLARAVLTGYVPVRIAFQSWRRVSRAELPPEPLPFARHTAKLSPRLDSPQVTVLIPTLDRYLYLRTVLNQWRRQTVKPLEIIVVDQTSIRQRDMDLAGDFADLPLKIIYLDRPGQCSARNIGILKAQGEHILFIDDDDEIPSTLVEDHLNNLQRFQTHVSCGVANEVGAGPLPKSFTYTRASDVFPANNTLVHRAVLRQSGLFDLAYEHSQRADGDLGIRVYLSGALMILEPKIGVLHHHAPRGGLRSHGARVITYASSRSSLTHRHLPSATEIYLACRYFTPRQVQEMLWLRVFGTFIIRGSRFQKITKLLISLLLLPNTLWHVKRRSQQARLMLRQFPIIPSLADEAGTDQS